MSGAGDIKITKDGNVLLHEMQIQHPTASLIARASTAQDDATGDGKYNIVFIIFNSKLTHSTIAISFYCFMKNYFSCLQIITIFVVHVRCTCGVSTLFVVYVSCTYGVVELFFGSLRT